MAIRVVVFPGRPKDGPVSASGKGALVLGATVAATLIVNEGGQYLYRNRQRIKEGLVEALESVEDFSYGVWKRLKGKAYDIGDWSGII